MIPWGWDPLNGSRIQGPAISVDRPSPRLGRSRPLRQISAETARGDPQKGLSRDVPPDEVILLARREVERGHAFRKAKFNDEIRDHFGLVGDEVRDALLTILDEVPPQSYTPPRELEDPPGCPFVFHCNYLRSDIYLKIQVAGDNKRPRVLLWSCHPPVY